MSEPRRGRISIGKTISSGVDSWATICLTDETSGSEFIEVTLSLEDFGNAVLGSSQRPCEYDLRRVALAILGKAIRPEEVKVYLDEFPDGELYDRRAHDSATPLLNEFAESIRVREGAHSIRKSDLTNGHRRGKDARGVFQTVVVWYYDEIESKP